MCFDTNARLRMGVAEWCRLGENSLARGSGHPCVTDVFQGCDITVTEPETDVLRGCGEITVHA